MSHTVELEDAESLVVRRALVSYANRCYNRANEIAQDREGRFSKPEHIGQAMDEAAAADRLVIKFRALIQETPDAKTP